MTDTEFSSDEFLNGAFGGSFDTTATLVDPGEYRATFIKPQRAAYFPPRESGGSGRVVLDLLWQLDAPEQSRKLNRDPLRVVGKLWLDVDAETKKPLTGANANLELGRLLQAKGLNGSEWAWPQLEGAGPFMVKVEHEKEKDGDRMFERVKRFSPAR